MTIYNRYVNIYKELQNEVKTELLANKIILKLMIKLKEFQSELQFTHSGNNGNYHITMYLIGEMYNLYIDDVRRHTHLVIDSLVWGLFLLEKGKIVNSKDFDSIIKNNI